MSTGPNIPNTEGLKFDAKLTIVPATPALDAQEKRSDQPKLNLGNPAFYSAILNISDLLGTLRSADASFKTPSVVRTSAPREIE